MRSYILRALIAFSVCVALSTGAAWAKIEKSQGHSTKAKLTTHGKEQPHGSVAGANHGKKTGWDCGMPDGQAKKQNCTVAHGKSKAKSKDKAKIKVKAKAGEKPQKGSVKAKGNVKSSSKTAPAATTHHKAETQVAVKRADGSLGDRRARIDAMRVPE